MPLTISRRRLLAVASTGAIAFPGAFLSFTWGYSEPESSGIDGDLIALCSELGCPKPIGKACLLALPPSERRLSSLSKAILGHDRMPGEGRLPQDAIAQSISQRSRVDFEEGRVLTVNGWILALTEARLYALAALLTETDDSRVSTKEPNGLTSAG